MRDIQQIFVLVVMLVVSVSVAACSSGQVSAANSTVEVVVLDSHGDKYLSYAIGRRDAKQGDRVVEGRVRWSAIMNPSAEPECFAGKGNSFLTMSRCKMSKTEGSAATAEEARAMILKHFEEFKANNALVKN